ncbi:hypothetical protein M434DRAFT_15834 [Hypoxylon sp. CO27-5]|nr:hypothetical protein M434DRAFT_15834 [Hypoxylon sp. CO27-5]
MNIPSFNSENLPSWAKEALSHVTRSTVLRDMLLAESKGLSRYASKCGRVEIDITNLKTIIESIIEPDDVPARLDLHIPNLVKGLKDFTVALQQILERLFGKNTCLLEPGEVVNKAAELTSKIFQSQDELRAILGHYGEKICCRWRERGLVKREEILLKAWPNMTAARRPETISSLRSLQTGSNNVFDSQTREAYTWPYINLKSLCTDDRLLLFLDSRSRNHPSVFAFSDLGAAGFGMKHAIIPVGYLYWCSMMIHVGTGEEERSSQYGVLKFPDPTSLDWDASTSDTEDLSLDNIGIPPGEGILMLEIQERIMKFLVDCCRLILQDIPEAQGPLIGPTPPDVPSISPPLVDENSSPTSLETIRAEAPYRVPSMINFRQLHRLVSAHRSDAEDRFWALREDPAFFSEAIRGIMAIFLSGGKVPVTPNQLTSSVQRLLGTTYGDIVLWDELESLLEKIIELQIPSKKLTLRVRYESYKATFDRLKDFTEDALEYFVSQINFFTKIQFNTTVESAGATTTLIEEFERIIGANPRIKNELTETLKRGLGNLFLVDEVSRQLILHQPSPRELCHGGDFPTTLEDIDGDKPFPATNYRRRRGSKNKTASELLATISRASKISSDIYDTVKPLKNKNPYPIYKPMSPAKADGCIMLEKKLDAFWIRADGSFQEECGATPNELLKNYIAPRDVLSERRRLKIIEPIQPRPEPPPPQGDMVPRAYTTLSPISFPRTPVNEKKKKRGVRQAPKEDNTPESTTSKQGESRNTLEPPLKLPSEYMRVIRALFFTASAEEVPQQIKWRDFLSTMTRLGFQIQYIYGSSYNFIPPGVNPSIVIHQPHPGHVIYLAHARRIGRRLTRTYGWTADHFEEE